MGRLAYRCDRVQSQQVYFPQDDWRAIGRNAKELNPELLLARLTRDRQRNLVPLARHRVATGFMFAPARLGISGRAEVENEHVRLRLRLYSLKSHAPATSPRQHYPPLPFSPGSLPHLALGDNLGARYAFASQAAIENACHLIDDGHDVFGIGTEALTDSIEREQPCRARRGRARVIPRSMVRRNASRDASRLAPQSITARDLTVVPAGCGRRQRPKRNPIGEKRV